MPSISRPTPLSRSSSVPLGTRQELARPSRIPSRDAKRLVTSLCSPGGAQWSSTASCGCIGTSSLRDACRRNRALSSRQQHNLTGSSGAAWTSRLLKSSSRDVGELRAPPPTMACFHNFSQRRGRHVSRDYFYQTVLEWQRLVRLLINICVPMTSRSSDYSSRRYRGIRAEERFR